MPRVCKKIKYQRATHNIRDSDNPRTEFIPHVIANNILSPLSSHPPNHWPYATGKTCSVIRASLKYYPPHNLTLRQLGRTRTIPIYLVVIKLLFPGTRQQPSQPRYTIQTALVRGVHHLLPKEHQHQSVECPEHAYSLIICESDIIINNYYHQVLYRLQT